MVVEIVEVEVKVETKIVIEIVLKVKDGGSGGRRLLSSIQ